MPQIYEILQIWDYSNDALALLSLDKTEEKYYLDFNDTVESKEFILIKEQSNIKHVIEDTQEALETAKSYTSNLHQLIKRGKYAKCPHARLTNNIRIIYIVDPKKKKLIYITILSKNDFENSLKIKPVNWIEKYKNL